MTNGQISSTSGPSALQLIAQDPTATVAASSGDLQQNGGDFARLLRGIQRVATDGNRPDAEQAVQPAGTVDKARQLPEIDANLLAVTALEQLQASQQVAPAADSAVKISHETEKTDGSADDLILSGIKEIDGTTQQMILAAYSQPGRMPEVNIPNPLPVDTSQNVTVDTAQPAVSAATVIKNQTAPTAEPEKPVLVRTAAVQPEAALQAAELSTSTALPADRLQRTATLTEQPAGNAASAATNQSEQKQAAVTEKPVVVQASPATIHQEAALQTAELSAQAILPAERLQKAATVQERPDVVAETPPVAVHPETASRVVELSTPVVLPVDRQQQAATVPEQPAVEAKATPVAVHLETASRTGELSAQVVLPAGPSSLKPSSAIDAEQNQQQTEKLHTTPTNPGTVAPVARDSVATPVISPELQVEIELSQPRPITAQVTTATALTGNRSAVPELQLTTTEPMNEHNRLSNEQNAGREVHSAEYTASSNGEALLNSDDSGNSSQGQPDTTPDNRLLAQDMRGQTSMEQQKVSAVTARQTLPETDRQNIPEQVVQQVKDRLVQHEVKPGNQQITLTLSPDTLGELKMNLNLQGQKLSVEIVTENRTVRDAIIQHTEALKESLARQNITMESFDVTSGGKGSGNQGQNQNAWRELAKQQQQQQFWSSSRAFNTPQVALASGKPPYQGQSMLDIHY